MKDMFGFNVTTWMAVFTGVVLVGAGIFLGAILLFKAHRAQTGDSARTVLNAFMGLFLVVVLTGGSAWFVVSQVGDNVLKSK